MSAVNWNQFSTILKLLINTMLIGSWNNQELMCMPGLKLVTFKSCIRKTILLISQLKRLFTQKSLTHPHIVSDFGYTFWNTETCCFLVFSEPKVDFMQTQTVFVMIDSCRTAHLTLFTSHSFIPSCRRFIVCTEVVLVWSALWQTFDCITHKPCAEKSQTGYVQSLTY